MPAIEELIGKTMAKVENLGGDELIFTTDDGRTFKFYHDQDCCEHVNIEDVIGDLSDLVGSPITMAEETVNERDENPPGVKVPKYQDDSFTWTFYRFATVKGYVTVRWYGESNGYYSESVHFEEVK